MTTHNLPVLTVSLIVCTLPKLPFGSDVGLITCYIEVVQERKLGGLLGDFQWQQFFVVVFIKACGAFLKPVFRIILCCA